MLSTEGNIDALLVTWNQRNYANSQVTNWSTRGIVLAMEKYDSLPYQLCSGAARPAGMNKINEGKADMDTLIAPSAASYFYDYSLTGSGGRAFAITSVNGLSGGSGPSPFYYQEAKIIRQDADSFALKKIPLLVMIRVLSSAPVPGMTAFLMLPATGQECNILLCRRQWPRLCKSQPGRRRWQTALGCFGYAAEFGGCERCLLLCVFSFPVHGRRWQGRRCLGRRAQNA